MAKAKGLDAFVSDMGNIKPAYKETLEKHGIAFEEGSHSFDRILSADEIIKSPGIPDKADIIKQAKAKNIPVISEIEFAGRYSKGKFICISGTNGKTGCCSQNHINPQRWSGDTKLYAHRIICKVIYIYSHFRNGTTGSRGNFQTNQWFGG